MGNEIVTFEDSVKSRIKNMLAELIPEDRLDAIVGKTIEEFERVEIPKLVREELTALFRQQITDHLRSAEYTEQYDSYSGQIMASEAVKQLIEQSAPKILSGMIGSAVQQAVNQMRYSM